MRNGNGTFFYSNGSKYEGEWVDNLKHGMGVFTFEDGSEYRGPFENDRMCNETINSKLILIFSMQSLKFCGVRATTTSC